jgi:hypothetical protein
MRVALALSSSTKTMVTVLIAGTPSQYFSLARNTIRSPLRHSATVYGPLPTGAVLKGALLTSTPSKAVRGTMPSVSSCANGAYWWDSRNTTVRPSGADTSASASNRDAMVELTSSSSTVS